MATFYLNGLAGSDAADGTTSGNAWATLQHALDTVEDPGDILLCYGSESITSQIECDINAGEDGAYIEVVGVNSDWEEEDGVYYVITANGGLTNGIRWYAACNFVHFRNFEITNAYIGLICQNYHNAFNNIIENFKVHDCDNDGIAIVGAQFTAVIKCKSYNNGGEGFYLGAYNVMLFCKSYNNIVGVNSNTGGLVMNGLIYGNSGDGVVAGTNSLCINNVIDDNGGDGISIGYNNFRPILNRITNNVNYGLDNLDDRLLEHYNAFYNNDDGAKHYNPINHTDLELSADGYTAGSGEYNLVSAAEGLNVEVSLD